MAKECDFDPAVDSIHGLTAESSTQREASAQGSEPMRNPYEQPSRRSGNSTQRETPDDQWEQQRSSSGSSEPPTHDPWEEDPWQNYRPTQDAQDNQQEEPMADTDDDPMGEEVVNLWEAEEPPDDDYVVEQATKSSISASNPWVLYEAGIICARNEDGEIIKNESGEKIIVLREWNCLMSAQKVALRRQSIGRADWEKLPWTGFTCFLLTRSWEMGRMQASLKKENKISEMRNFLDNCRIYWTDWMLGMREPSGWDTRYEIDKDNWSEKFLLYERDLAIQNDMEYLTEAVFVFYTKHLDRLIRENDKLWGDFCRRRVDRYGNILEELELYDRHIDTTIPGARIPMNKKTVIPEPEKHFSFSTKLMVLAIDLYEEESPPSYSPFTAFTIKKLRQFVDNRKDFTAQSYRFFVEHAYNQFFQHEAFHQSATARTRVKEFGAGKFSTSTKLEAYVWIAGEKKMTHVPKDQADDVRMQDDDESEGELDDLPRLQVTLKSEEKREEKSGGSLEKEEPQAEEVQDDEDILDDVVPPRSAFDRWGQFLVKQLSPAHQRLLHEIALSAQGILRDDDLEGRPPIQRGDLSYTSLEMMMEFLAQESFDSFMNLYGPVIQYRVEYDDYHVLHMSMKRVLENNKHIKPDNFEDIEEPELADDNPETPLPRPEVQTNTDPEFKNSVENLSRENKHLILETDDDDLVECTVKWFNMCSVRISSRES